MNIRRIILVFILFILIFSCKKNNTSETMTEYYDYTGKNVEEFYLNSEKLIILNYWATYCAPCKKEMVDFSKLNTEYEEDVMFIGASIDSADKISLIKKLCTSLGVNYSILYGVKPNFKGIEITGLPTTYILRDGEIKEEIIGKRDYEYFKNAIEKYMVEEKIIKDVIDESSENYIEVKESGEKKVKKDYTKKKMIIKKFYEIEYVTKKMDKSFEMKITLKPVKGFYLNGEGYPPLKITFEEADGFITKPDVLSVEGVKEGKSFSWDVVIENKNNKDGFNLKAAINSLACTDEQCNIANDELVFKY